MPGKADKPTQNSALQGISEQENFRAYETFSVK